MNFEQALDYIRSNADYSRRLRKSKHGNYICPQCRSGEGTNRTGALSVDNRTNKFKCFACNWHGDYIDFIQGIENTDFNGAFAIAAAELGVVIDHENGRTNEYKVTADKLPNKDIKTAVTADYDPTAADYSEYYIECMTRLTEPAAISYLQGRGISLETAQNYAVGYDPKADPANAPGAAAADFKPHPTPRLIFPTTKWHYVGRSIDPNTPKGYKAMNPKGGGVRIWNQEAIYTGGTVFVCEGVFTALSVIECGHKAIAINSENNGNLLLQALDEKESTAAFIICFDNDPNADTKARTRAAAEALNSQLQARNYTSLVFDIAGYCKDGETDLNDILQRDKKQLQNLINTAENTINRDSLTDFLEQIKTEAYKPYTTGLQFFDDILSGGVIKQTLLVVSAAPGAGKTTLCQQIAEEMAARKKPVIYLNFEMSREQMLAKTISSKLARAGKEYSTTAILQGYKWTTEQELLIAQAVDEYRQTNYPYIKYNPGNIKNNLEKILDYLQDVGEKATAAGTDAPAVIVDYLHLISTENPKTDAQELIKQAVKGFKDYAIKYNTFVIAISAVSRAAMSKGPLSMSSGRDSSNIEYTADYVLTLNYWDIDQEKIDPQDDNAFSQLQKEKWRRMILRLPKARYGQPGNAAKVYFNAASNYFLGVTGFEPIPADAIPFGGNDIKTDKKTKRL